MTTIEEFLLAQDRASKRLNISALNYLYDNFPCLAERACDEMIVSRQSDSVDKEGYCRYPIMIDSRQMTETRILNVVSYLTGKLEVPMNYRDFLREQIPYREIFNYETCRWQKSYELSPLWQGYFLKLPALQKIMEARRITSFDELVYRAQEYFENYERKILKNGKIHSI